MTKIAYDPAKMIEMARATGDDCLDLGRHLRFTTIPNDRLVAALMIFAKTISVRDESSKEAYRAMLHFLADLAIKEAA